MKPTMYCLTLGLGTLAAVVMSVPAYPAVETTGSVESTVSSRPTRADGDLKLAELECSAGGYSDPEYGEGLAIACWYIP